MKKKIMFHYIMPGALGGPNVCMDRIFNVVDETGDYDLGKVSQNYLAGGTINIGLIANLYKQIKKFKPDIIHMSGMQSSGFHIAIAAYFARVPIRIITVHGFSGNATKLSIIKRFAFTRVIEPITLFLSTYVVANSKFTFNNKMLSKYANNKRTCIYNLPPFNIENQNKENIRIELKLNDKDIVFTSIGRIVEDKGFPQLSKAIKLIKMSSNAKFIVVGDGPYRSEMEKYLKEDISENNVFFLGKRDDVKEILESSDVFVLPSLHETFGNVYMEASICGIPSIGLNVGGVPEIIKNNITGKLLSSPSVDELVDAMNRLMDDGDLRREMGCNAKELASNKFSIKKLSKDYIRLYQRLLIHNNN